MLLNLFKLRAALEVSRHRAHALRALRLERLQVLAWLEAYSLSRRDIYFRAGPGVSADAGLPRFHGKHTEAAQLDPIIGLEGVFHAIEDGIDCLFRFCFADSRPLHDLIHEIEFDHLNLRIFFISLFLPSGDELGNAN
jgi:hypothetical protein